MGFSALEEFWRGIRKERTRKAYTRRLEKYFEFLRQQKVFKAKGSLEYLANRFKAKASVDSQWAYYCASLYMDHLKEVIDNAPVERRDSMSGTLWNHHKAIKKFYDMCDIAINWRKVDVALPRPKGYASDRKIELAEIQRILQYQEDSRLRPLVLIMASAGIDISSFEYLNWGHIKPIIDQNNEHVIAAWVRVYKAKTDTWYDTLITPEAYDSALQYITYRYKAGEKTARDSDSPILRNLFYPEKRARKEAFAHIPNRLHVTGAIEVVEDALWARGIRQPLVNGKTRHEFQATKAFRKFFTTTLDEAGVPERYCALLRGDTVGFRTASYHRPSGSDLSRPFVSERELLDQYLKAIPGLTITPEWRLRSTFDRKVDEKVQLERSSRRISDRKLADLERAYSELQQRVDRMEKERLRISEAVKAKSLAD